MHIELASHLYAISYGELFAYQKREKDRDASSA